MSDFKERNEVLSGIFRDFAKAESDIDKAEVGSIAILIGLGLFQEVFNKLKQSQRKKMFNELRVTIERCIKEMEEG